MPQARPTNVRLRYSALFRYPIDLDFRIARSTIPEFGVAPVQAFVPVGEFDLFDVVDAPGDEADALALLEVPRVDVVFGVAGVFVGVVVAGAGEEGVGGGIGWGGQGGAGRQEEVEDGGEFHGGCCFCLVSIVLE